ncbi:F-box protein At2g26850 [Neltuma alba]|uniref:F-box protein At2g26850 n=1 Tax=Neltuma alba TaxID=207710 RepID=UPI0010A3D6D3|nr:F-box protein At2g26850-like [Prosopis alba]
MLCFLLSFLSFLIVLSKSLTGKPIGFWESLSSSLSSQHRKSEVAFSFSEVPPTMSVNKDNLVPKVGSGEEACKFSPLDLPDLALDCVLEKLSPADLCNMASVCPSLRERCRSDYLWEKHIERKWGKVIGASAYRQWRWYVASRNREKIFHRRNQKGIFASLQSFSPFQWIKTKSGNGRQSGRSVLPDDSFMALYLSLENGKFWFPAQVYNRENGHAGFMLSCYDAQLCYDSRTDTFQARYLPHARWSMEENIHWDRLRMPPIDISSHVLYTSDRLDDLKPGDHIEIQWRRNKDYPYGWWYGVVGHLESCQGHVNHCHCHFSDMVVLEFKQYALGCRWRQAVIDRKHHREEGDEVDGFYGGIRKLYGEEEIRMWTSLWPDKLVE